MQFPLNELLVFLTLFIFRKTCHLVEMEKTAQCRNTVLTKLSVIKANRRNETYYTIMQVILPEDEQIVMLP